ncbi:hypothetical protein CRG98_029042 [Punica granatum]|uniref:Uncharacterized protein n=1 Tax=Punica granatum TaxID=22663 RepID=A0A2I0J2V6_PUNGR|nr:hypothetical protein CRG98_029042 [Punica granatum]
MALLKGSWDSHSTGRISHLELVLRKANVRALHHPFPTTLRAREIILAQTAELTNVSRVALRWSQTSPGKPLGLVFDKRRIQWYPEASEHSGSTEKAPIANSQDVSSSRSSAEAYESTVSLKAQNTPMQVSRAIIPRGATYDPHSPRDKEVFFVIFGTTQVLARSATLTSTFSSPLGVEKARANLEEPSRAAHASQVSPDCPSFLSGISPHSRVKELVIARGSQEKLLALSQGRWPSVLEAHPSLKRSPLPQNKSVPVFLRFPAFMSRGYYFGPMRVQEHIGRHRPGVLGFQGPVSVPVSRIDSVNP